MKPRVWNTVRTATDQEGRVVSLPDGGDEEAAQYAQALANLCDAETLRSLVDGIVLLQRVGGELYLGSYRIKVDAEGYRIPPDEMVSTPGTYMTAGYLFAYDPVAKQTREATQAPPEPQPSIGTPIPLVATQDLEDEAEPEEEPAPEPVAAAG